MCLLRSFSESTSAGVSGLLLSARIPCSFWVVPIRTDTHSPPGRIRCQSSIDHLKKRKGNKNISVYHIKTLIISTNDGFNRFRSCCNDCICQFRTRHLCFQSQSTPPSSWGLVQMAERWEHTRSGELEAFWCLMFLYAQAPFPKLHRRPMSQSRCGHNQTR